jgi:hypothetical protein
MLRISSKLLIFLAMAGVSATCQRIVDLEAETVNGIAAYERWASRARSNQGAFFASRIGAVAPRSTADRTA